MPYIQRTISLTPNRSGGERIDIANTGGLHVARLTAPDDVVVQIAFDVEGASESSRVSLRPGRRFFLCFDSLWLFHPATTGVLELISFSRGEDIADAGAGAGLMMAIRSNDGATPLRAIAKRLDEGLPANTMAFGGGPEDPGSIHAFRFGDAERFFTALVAAMRFYFPDATGTDGQSSDVMIDGGRGRGAGTPGRFVFRVSTPGASGATLQALADAFSIRHDKLIAHKPLELLAGLVGGVSAAPERTGAVIQVIKQPGVATVLGVGIATPTFTGAANLDGTWGRMLLCSTSAVINNAVGSSVLTLGPYHFNMDHTWFVRTSTDITNIRLWCGLSTAGLSGSATPTTESMAAFRYSTDVDGTAFWRTVTHDGTANPPEVTTTTHAIATTTEYRLRIVRLSSGNVEFYINDALVATHSSARVPSGAQISAAVFSVTTLAAAVKSFGYGRMAVIDADP